MCGASLDDGEEVLCLKCDIGLPRTAYHLRADNPVERRFWGRFPLERATSYFRYRKGGDYRRILWRMKYEGRQDYARAMGRLMAAVFFFVLMFIGAARQMSGKYISLVDVPVWKILAASCGGAAVLLAVSCLISTVIYNRKEF